MRALLILLMSLAGVASTIASADALVQSRYPLSCIFQAVAAHLNVTIRPEIPLPKLFYGSEISLPLFQDMVEAQWHQRPDTTQFNIYVWARNEIYVMDDQNYYLTEMAPDGKSHRTVEDSIAHELVHYIQVQYQHDDLNEDPFAEGSAVDTQNWFRSTYSSKGLNPCPNS